MATPEKLGSQPPEQDIQLRLILGGQALDEQVTIAPVTERATFDSLLSTLDEPNWANMSAEELLEIRESLSTFRGNLATHIHELSQEHDAALSKLIWINGFIRDRQQPL